MQHQGALRSSTALCATTVILMSCSLHSRAIGLLQVLPEVNIAAEGADLVIMEGMGRGIETNLHAHFTCDSLNLGMVKHPEVCTCMQEIVSVIGMIA